MGKKFHIYFTALIIIILSISGCASNNNHRSAGRGRAKAIIEKGTNKVYRRGGSYSMQTPDTDSGAATAAPPANSASNEERSQKIAKAVTGLNAIKSASVVITGNTAIVGVQTDGNYNDTALIEIKRMVEERVKSVDKGIDHISVTTAIDLIGRINRMPQAGTSEDPPIAGPSDFVPRG